MTKGKKKDRAKKSPKTEASASGPPMHPGFLVRRDFLNPSGLTEEAFGDRAGISRGRVSGIVSGTRPVTKDSADKLEIAYGADSEALLVQQARYDVFMRRRRQRPPPGKSQQPPERGPSDPPCGPA